MVKQITGNYFFPSGKEKNYPFSELNFCRFGNNCPAYAKNAKNPLFIFILCHLEYLVKGKLPVGHFRCCFNRISDDEVTV
jgi:hypothetical protein